MKQIDLTQGPIVKGIVAFALPLLGTSIVQQLYSTVDLLFVGNVLGTNAMAALGIGALLITLLAGLFSGVSVGVNVKIANLAGAGEEDRLVKGLATTLVLAFSVGIALVVLGEAFAAPFVTLMEVPIESADLALVYVRFGVAVALPMAVYNACAGALRGVGDSKSPLIAQLVGGLCNIAANWFALCILGWGIAGCAAATLVSNVVAAAIALVVLVRGWHLGAASVKRLLDLDFAKRVLLFGIPIGAQTVAITLSNVFVQYQIDLLGVESIAAFAAYLKVELPIYFVILAIGQATTTFVAQNHGAYLFDRCRKGIWSCQVLCIALAIVMSVLMLAVGYWAFWLFDQSEAVIGVGLSMIAITFPFYFVYAVLEVQADAMRGYGHSLGPALVVLVNICVLRVVLVGMFVSQGLGIEAIAASYPITWTTTALCLGVMRFVLVRRKLHSKED